ncbi:MAG: SGNH/GDSL hydrolase family protein [Planctomycetaceae bacterium]
MNGASGSPDPLSSQAPSRPRRSRRTRLAIVAGAVIAGLVLAEAGYRLKLFLQVGQTPLGVQVTYRVWNEPTILGGGRAGYSHEPDRRVVGVRVTNGQAVVQLERTTNETGNVGPSESGYDEASTRILVVGDSFTEIQRQQATWPMLLEAELARRLDHPTAVLNRARSGHGLLQMVDVAADVAGRRRPGIVVVAFISDDLNRSRFWQNIEVVNGEPRLATRLSPEGTAWLALGEFYEPRIDAAWCSRVLASSDRTDDRLEDLERRFAVRKRENPRRIDYAAPTSSFLYNRLTYGDPFFGITGAAATPRFAWRDFRRDDRMVRAWKQLGSFEGKVVLAHLPQYEELLAGEYRLTGQQRSLLASLEQLAGVPVVDLIKRGKVPARPASLFLLPHDHHPSRQGLAWYAEVVAEVLEELVTETKRRDIINREGTHGRSRPVKAAGGRRGD